MRQYTVILNPEPEDGGYTVRVPALPGCNTQGDTREEALANAQEAIEGYLESLKELGRPIPEEQERPEAVVIDVAA
jgi:antitoxin HicB